MLTFVCCLALALTWLCNWSCMLTTTKGVQYWAPLEITAVQIHVYRVANDKLPLAMRIAPSKCMHLEGAIRPMRSRQRPSPRTQISINLVSRGFHSPLFVSGH
eukprot:jgi/Botrbrau1/16811/Bobra.150_2s0038.1